MFKTAAGGLKITHIPYKGTAPGLAALLAGEVEIMFDNLGVTVQHVRSGRLRALAVGSGRRAALAARRAGDGGVLSGFRLDRLVQRVGARRRLPPPSPRSSRRRSPKRSGSPRWRRRLADLSAEPIASTPAAMAALMKEDAERWRAVIRAAGVKPE